MKVFVCCALALLALMKTTSAETCVDLTKVLPCDGKLEGNFHICDFCEHGYFANCKNGQVVVMPCTHVALRNGDHQRLIFDDASQTCVKKTPSCPQAALEINWY